MAEIADFLLHGPAMPNSKYTENIRAFALTLYFHSPRAYFFMRKKFKNHLPHKTTISKWYANSSVNGESGFCSQSLEILAQKVHKMKVDGIEPICALVFDEMSIRKHLQWSRAKKQFLGQIDYGFRPDCSEVPIANNAIVFMLKGINFELCLPLAHYFINTLKAEEKAALLKVIITKITGYGVRLLSVTFDGLGTNIKTCKVLGANFRLNKLEPFFQINGDERRIYVILDPSHMIKLARNLIGNKKVLIDEADLKIEWTFFESLEKMRAEKEFTHMHKLTKRHIDFKNVKMNVRIASQTLSDSVANSMECLMNQGYTDFSGSSPTIKYIRHINKCFDIMNSTGTENENMFKNSISPENKTEIFSFFREISEYLKRIKLSDGKTVVYSPNRAAFRGFIINAMNFKLIYEECVDTVYTSSLDCLKTYKFSQDHLESFFGRIRAVCGSNDNPTVEQFTSAFKKNVICNEIKASEDTNCIDTLNLTVLQVSSRGRNRANIDLDTKSNGYGASDDSDDSEDIDQLGSIEKCYEENVDECAKISIAHIAGSIEKRIEKSGRFECGDCYTMFADNHKIVGDFTSMLRAVPCQSTFDICEIAHKFVENIPLDFNYTYKKAMADIIKVVQGMSIYTNTNFEGHEIHKEYFIEFIASSYVDIQATYIAKRVTLKEQTLMLRNKFRKMVHFAGE